MRVYTYSEARQNLADLLDQAGDEGEVRIRRRDGSEYVIRPRQRDGSPLDVPPVDTGVSTEEIVAAVREGRERATR
ncbi:type II toxin-antitoxin system Phd/YefM family antitoxin [Salinibacter ruber]|uniref:type II toxin-antitoxin system Phd/YefM family antitoxin n=1 Tax=Salinibacter ruber TaxID=146919 RepID=UPI000E56F72C